MPNLKETLKRYIQDVMLDRPPHRDHERVVEDFQLQINTLSEKLATLKSEAGFVPPGHFYSPIPALCDIERDADTIFRDPPRKLPGIELDEPTQMKLLTEFSKYYAEIPFGAQAKEGLRYYYENPAYSYSDAILLHCMIRHIKPRKVIEIGSGYSSCVVLDTDELFLGGTIRKTFIEPYPDLLLSLITEEDRNVIEIIPSRLQDVDLCKFNELESGDILFIDSTHVSKVNSDVNRIIFEILPALKSGVYIHFHDIFYPFEYPREWIFEGRSWTEAYLLRAFLQFNSGFKVILMNTFMEYFHEEFFQQKMPLCLKNRGGSIWLCKT